MSPARTYLTHWHLMFLSTTTRGVGILPTSPTAPPPTREVGILPTSPTALPPTRAVGILPTRLSSTQSPITL